MTRPIPFAIPEALPRLSRLVPRMKRWCLLAHLYLGVAFCALFIVWFVSGVVMMYQGYPSLTAREKLAQLPPIDCSTCRVSVAAVLAVAPPRASLADLRLGMLGRRPVWRLRDSAGRWSAVYADTAARVEPLDTLAASAIAAEFVAPRRHRWMRSPTAHYVSTLIDADQWTLTRTVRAQMPLMRFDIDDAVGTRAYVSPRSGEVVSLSSHRERVLSWFGAIPHWIYPTMLRRHAAAWSALIIGLSGLGTIMSLAGLAIGVWQWRWRPRVLRNHTRQARSPYRDFMMRWHHVFGLIFGVFVCTWVFSGLMSMNPGSWSPGAGLTATQTRAWAGDSITPAMVLSSPHEIWEVLRRAGRVPKELRFTQVAGRAYWIASDGDNATSLVRADSEPVMLTRLPVSMLVSQAAALIPQAQVRAVVIMDQYDQYYRDPDKQRPLPVLRIKLDDPARTWVYIDPATGAIAQKREWRSRLERWLYDGLHTLDFEWLISRRPLWDVVLITLSLGGLLCSVTGMVVAWRWLRATLAGNASRRRRSGAE